MNTQQTNPGTPQHPSPAPQTVLGRFRVRYFSSLDWKYLDLDVVGESEAQVYAWVEGECPRSCRNRPYTNDNPPVDTLSIERLGDVTLPFVIGND